VNRPRVIFCDAPTGNLDSQTGQAVADLLFRIQEEQGTSLVIVTHEAELAARAQRHVVLRDGLIVSETAVARGT
jgi:putative ABC transport system ATP-binding protein